MTNGIVGALVGGATVYLLTRDGKLITDASRRPVRRYRGYPSDTDGVYEAGNVVINVGPPVGWGWEILAMHWLCLYAGGGGGGTPIINIYDRSDRLLLPVYHPPRAAGINVLHYYTQRASYPEFAIGGNAGMVYPLPLNGELKDEYLAFDMGGAAVDEHRVFIYYEEFQL